jgi:CheY-like chemotaxis protein
LALAWFLLLFNVGEKTNASKFILIVDDEKLFLKSVTDGLKPYEKKNKFKTLTAPNGREALSILSSQEIALLVTDLRMPEMDGLALIAQVHNHFPTLPVIVMTAFGSPEIEKQVKDMGILHYLEKPIGFDEFRDHVLNEMSHRKRGRIEGITLASFLQLLWMEKSTCMLAVKNQDNAGTLMIFNGELQGAESDGEAGRDAALRILSWQNVSIEMDDQFTPSREPLHINLEELLLESFRLQDEENNGPLIEYEDLEVQDRLLTLEPGEMLAQPAEAKRMEDKTKNKTSKKEERMNVQKLNKSIDTLKENLGGALLAADIWGTADMQSIAGFNSQPAATALFGQLINSTNRALKDSGFPILGKYIIFDLVDGKMVALIPMGDYAWGMLIDGKKAQLGLLLNVALPKAIASFEDAITS